MLDFQKFFQGDEDEDAREGDEEGWKKVTKGKVGRKKSQEGLERFFYKGFSRKNSAATPLVSIKGRRDEE